MTSLLSARKRAEEFAAAVDGRTPATSSAQLQDLLPLVSARRQHEPVTPRADFSASLRERLMVEAETALIPSAPLALPQRSRTARDRRLTIAASAFVLIGGSAGMAAAAQNAVPGDALYPLKRGLEGAQSSMSRNDAAKGKTYLASANDRLDEARSLVDSEAAPEAITTTLETFTVQAMTGSDLLLADFDEERSPSDVAEVRAFAADALAGLQELAKTAPPETQEALTRAGFVLQRIDEQALSACSTCSDLPALQVPMLMERTAQITQALEAARTESRKDQSHPTLGIKLPPSTVGGGSTAAPRPDVEDGGGSLVPGDSTGIGTGAGLPSDPKDVLDGVDQATGGLLGQVGSKTTDVLPESSLTDTLKDPLPTTD